MAVNLTTVRLLAFILSAVVCCMLIQSSTAAEDGSTPGASNTPEQSSLPTSTSLPTTTETITTTTTPAPTTPTPQGGSCTIDAMCINNLTCIGGQCGCDTSTFYYKESTQSCVPKNHYGESCNASVSNVCLGSNTICKNTRVGSLTKCLCVDTFYRPDSGQCISVDNLVITINSVSTTTNSASLTWTDNVRRNNVTFNITSSSSSSTQTTSIGKSDAKVVSGLTAGTEYTFSVTSVLPADDYYNVTQKSGSGFKIYTKPAAPVNVTWNLDTSKSSESQFMYTVTITKGEGNAASFLFTLVGPGASQPGPIPNTSGQTVTTSVTLVLEQTYNYTVIAQNNDGNQSQPLYGTYTPRNTVANIVSNVRLTSSLDRVSNQVNLVVTWQPGAITGITTYYIQVLEASDRDGAGFRVATYYQVQGYNNTSYPIPNVKASWLYQVSVMAGTSGGNSSWVPAAQNRTVESAANNITDLTLTSNRDVSTNKVNLVISWTSGGFTGVTTYYIWVQEEAGSGWKDFKNYSVAGYDNTSLNISGVRAYWMYKVSVMATTKAGNSAWVPVQTMTVESRPDTVQITVQNISSQNATIAWQPPVSPNGVITNYLVQVLDQQNGTCYFNLTVAAVNDCSQYQAQIINGSTCGAAIPVNCSLLNSKYSLVLGLQPFTNYTVVVAAVNNVGVGDQQYLNFSTIEGVANSVRNLQFTSSRNQSSGLVNLITSWTPGQSTGLTKYYVLIQAAVDLDGTEFSGSEPIVMEGYDNKTCEVKTVLAYWYYNVSVWAETNAGRSPLVSAKTQTAESCPGEVLYFHVTQTENKAKNLEAKFSCPDIKDRNGIINNFRINYTNGVSTEAKVVSYNGSCNSNVTEPFENVAVEQNYNFTIYAATKTCPGLLKHFQINSQAKPPKLDDVMKELNVKSLVSTSSESKNTETDKLRVTVCSKCLLDDSQGNVTDVGLVVCVKDSNPSCKSSARKKRDETTKYYSQYGTWYTSKVNDFKFSYRTTPDDWKQSLKNDEKLFQYVIGDNSTCPSVPLNTFYCNGPLPSGKSLIITVVVCTSGGCSVHHEEESFSTKSDDESPVGAIVGGVLGGLALLAVIGVIIFLVWHFRRRNSSRKTRKSSYRQPQIVDKRPVKMRDFNSHVMKFHRDSNLLFQDEYEGIQALSKALLNTTNDAQSAANSGKNRYGESAKLTNHEAQKEANRVKNRYVDILPFDHTRVKLSTLPEDEDTNDFINANYIPGYSSPREYIATQGPMHCTFPDFWKMIWEQNSRIIVMLSDLTENGKRKVDMYWPENLNEPINYGTVVVEMTNFSSLKNEIIVRNFTVTKGDETRKLSHFFTKWEDFSAKIDMDVLLGFIKLVRQDVKPSTLPGPIVVHCSAGVGRTGTYIAVDYFVQFIEKHSLDDDIDVFDFVMKMRKHRTRMVQVESQYIFIYDVINKLIQKKIKEEEERIYENTNGNIYANVNQTQEENIYANGQVQDNRYVYSNDAFEPDQASDTMLLKEKPLTEL